MRSNTSRHRRWAGLAGMALVALSAVVSVGAVVGTAAAGVGYQQRSTVEVAATVSILPTPGAEPTVTASPPQSPLDPASSGTGTVRDTADAATPQSTMTDQSHGDRSTVAISVTDDAGPSPEVSLSVPVEAVIVRSPEPVIPASETPAL